MSTDWIELNLPFGEVYGDDDEEDSFVKRGLNKPGIQIRMEDGKIYLIGDINPMRGVCDCCPSFRVYKVVVAYRNILEEH